MHIFHVFNTTVGKWLTVMSVHHSPHVILCDIIPLPLPLEGCMQRMTECETSFPAMASLTVTNNFCSTAYRQCRARDTPL